MSSRILRAWMALLALALAVAALSPAPARAESAAGGTYYVAVDGSDTSGDGSSARPWKTISRALRGASDGSLILVRPGTYTGQVMLAGRFRQTVTIRSETPYLAKLRNSGQVVVANGNATNIVFEGFDVAHAGPGSSVLVMHIMGDGVIGSLDNVTFRNNIFHDSFNNDILKIDDSASGVTVENNIFYNQTGADEHIDVNSATDVVIQDNIFFNAFAASGRSSDNTTSSYIVIKDSGGDRDQVLGSRNITVRRNIFLNWEGLPSSSFIMVGEDGMPYFEAQGVLIENNLMLGNSRNNIRSPIAVWGSKDVTIRNNTISGDLPSSAYAFALAKTVSNRSNENIRIYNNIWSDPSGTMGALAGSSHNDFCDARPTGTASWALGSNLYWNGGRAIPTDSDDLINYTNDARRVVADPRLANPGGINLPAWNASDRRFGDGSTSIRQVFTRLAGRFAAIPGSSPAANAGDPNNAPADDILGKPRSGRPDIGAFEAAASLTLNAVPYDRTLLLTWETSAAIPDSATWVIEYSGPAGDLPSPVGGIAAGERAVTLTGLQNYFRYTLTVSAVDGGETIVLATARGLPTDKAFYMPLMVADP